MAEKIISPGVFTRENDLSFVQQGVAQIGAAIVGPTVKGPALIPTQVFSYSEYQALYGDSFKSGSNYFQYLTSITAKEYLKHGGPATIVRIMPTDAGNANSYTHLEQTAHAGTAPSGSINFNKAIEDGTSLIQYTSSLGETYLFKLVDEPVPADNTSAVTGGSSTGIYYISGSFLAGILDSSTISTVASRMTTITGDTFTSQSATEGARILEFTSSVTSTGAAATIISGSSHAGISSGTVTTTGMIASTSSLAARTGVQKSGSTYANPAVSFQIKTHTDGKLMNSFPGASLTKLKVESNDVLVSQSVSGEGIKFGTRNNLRWEVTNVSEKKGTFTLLIRRGDDSKKRKVILETWNNLSLDPNERNYIGAVIGTQRPTVGDSTTANPYIQPSGNYKNRSQFVYIDESTVANTIDYLDENGNIRDTNLTGSLPINNSSGSFFGGSDGTGFIVDSPLGASGVANYYENSTPGNFQGLDVAADTDTGYIAYNCAFNLLSNQDEYDINLLVAPGLTYQLSAALTNKMVTVCEERGDVMTIIDPVDYSTTNIASVVQQAENFDSSYAAMYWPWVQIADPSTGKYIWVPQSVIMPSIYAFNDKVSAEWFAPAGLNRGGQETVVQAARKLTHANRDVLYEGNVNPVATFPGEGVCVWGQKTLQKKASALDRVNVRRLLINLKKFIASVSKFLLFENNTTTTRNRFLSQVNPYMESVQQRQGLYAFKVVMDETNNTPDIIDRNIMKGDIFIQPAKAAEFIVVDFNIMPTGATFND